MVVFYYYTDEKTYSVFLDAVVSPLTGFFSLSEMESDLATTLTKLEAINKCTQDHDKQNLQVVVTACPIQINEVSKRPLRVIVCDPPIVILRVRRHLPGLTFALDIAGDSSTPPEKKNIMSE